ncbi:MAG: hypothetical protein HYW15_00555 [Candidatus Giovannonibacteria bacterium]|nr:MAG: hypothetical protein HYW15_00555 [Candidatus Giovannonibacteria bacterium]
MKTFYKNLIFAIFLAAAGGAGAQTFSSPNDFTLNVSPQSPRAGSAVTVTARSFAFDGRRASFAWFLGGKKVDSGVGLSEKTFTAGKLGTELNIIVEVASVEGLFYEARANINVADIDFVVHPLTHTPLLYRGAALATPGSEVGIIAVPHLFRNGAKLKPQNLIYEWSLDRKPLLSQSGGGRNKLLLRLADIRGGEYEISLRVSAADNEIFTGKTARFKTAAPEIVFYKTNPLTGQGSSALSSFFARAGEQFSILAEPFYFGLDSLSRAGFDWRANGEKINPDAGNPRLLNLEAPAGAESAADVSITIKDAKALFQNAEGRLNIKAEL